MKKCEVEREAMVVMKTGEVKTVYPGKDCYLDACNGERIEYKQVASYSTDDIINFKVRLG